MHFRGEGKAANTVLTAMTKSSSVNVKALKLETARLDAFILSWTGDESSRYGAQPGIRTKFLGSRVATRR